MGEVATEKVAGTDLKVGITVCMHMERNKKETMNDGFFVLVCTMNVYIFII